MVGSPKPPQNYLKVSLRGYMDNTHGITEERIGEKNIIFAENYII